MPNHQKLSKTLARVQLLLQGTTVEHRSGPELVWYHLGPDSQKQARVDVPGTKPAPPLEGSFGIVAVSCWPEVVSVLSLLHEKNCAPVG